VDEIRQSVAEEKAAGSAYWREVRPLLEECNHIRYGSVCLQLWQPGIRRRLLIACTLQLWQQLTGINVILYYAADLFERMGVSRDAASTGLVTANAAVLVLGTLPGMWLVERQGVGRRKLLIVGGVAMVRDHDMQNMQF
jgi:hypothetical protein